jgi:arabinogalactan oligomer/maltooligosaccharide transport system substrate-binding protein
VTITVWLTYHLGSGEYSAFNQTVKAFEATYPYIHLNLQSHDPTTAQADFVTASLAGQAPDVLRAANDWVGAYVEAGQLAPLNPFVNSTFLSQYFPAALQDFSFQGHLWGLPENINGLALVYNKALLPSGPPTTTDQLLSMCPSLTKTNSSGAISQACIVFPSNNGYWWWPFLTGFGGTIFSPTNPSYPTINTTQAVQSIQFMNTLINDGYMPPNSCCTTMSNMFASGKAAMIIDGPWDESTYTTAGINYGVAPLPTVSSTGKPMGPLIGSQGWVIASGKPADETAAAFKFIAWFTNEQHQADEFTATGDLPSNSLLANTSTLSSNPLASGYLAQAATSSPAPNVPAMGSVYNYVGTALSNVQPTSKSSTITASAIKSALDTAEADILRIVGTL